MILASIKIFLEEWLSGLKQLSTKQSCPKVHRRFESYFFRIDFGSVCEWFKQSVLKTDKPQGFKGSNPFASV